MGSESEEKKEMLVIDGNAFYEIDLECVKKKKQCAQTVHPEKKTDRINSRNMKDKDNIRQHGKYLLASHTCSDFHYMFSLFTPRLKYVIQSLPPHRNDHLLPDQYLRR